jgi:signal transduction histidine kinase
MRRLLIATALFCVAALAEGGERQKHVLALFSTGRGAQFAVVAERNLPSLLHHGMKEGVEYFSEYIDSPMFSRPEYPTAYRDFLRLKYRAQRIDLVIAVGRLAVDFLAINRAALFPNTPVVFYDIDPPRVRIPNSTGLVNQLHFKRSLDLALALQPDVKHVYVVSGAGASDRENEQRARREFLPLAKRIDFTYFSGLATRDLEARLRTLPPRSAVFVVLVTRDGAGEIVQQMDYLSRIASVANAPTYSWADAAVDAGIVGGSRRDQLAETKSVATLALRLLKGARADDIPVSWPRMDVVQVDWRQLKRWGIDEGRVPTEAIVLFREPTAWERYKAYILVAIAVVLLQTALIAGLFVHRVRLRRAEVQVRNSQIELRASYDRIHDLGGRLLTAQEEERSRIAREIHDDISQQIAVLAMSVDAIGGDDWKHQRKMAAFKREMTSRIDLIAGALRGLAYRLHPTRLELCGLTATIDSVVRELQSRSEIAFSFSHEDVPTDLPGDMALSLFRIVQEALQNIVKHSAAHKASIHLESRADGLMLSIADDGVGFDVATAWHRGLGLVSMAERLEILGGKMTVHSTLGGGTDVLVSVPLPATVQATAMSTA